MQEKTMESYGFPGQDGVVAGSVTAVKGGYLGQTIGGSGFIIGNETKLYAAFRAAAEELAAAVILQLEGVENLQKQVNFTFMIDDKNSLVPDDLPDTHKQILLHIIQGFRSGKFNDAEEISPDNIDEPTIIRTTSLLGDRNNDGRPLKDNDGMTSSKLEEIRTATEKGETVVIEKNKKT